MRSQNKRREGLKTCLTFLALVVVYLVMFVPFKVMVVIPGFTEIRPVLLLKPVFGIFFGIPGCLAFAVGNFIGDLIGGSLKWSSIAGFAANFAGPFVFWLFWSRLSKAPFSLKDGKALPCYNVSAYTEILKEMLQILPPEVTIHRLTGDPPKKLLIFPSWTADKKKTMNYIRNALLIREAQR